MVIVYDGSTKDFQTLEDKTPQELGLRETWVQDLVSDQSSGILGEPLLVISREFQGFSTKERPDILALDERGNVVVIELKRGKAGEDAATQSVKYAAYCSQMNPENVIEAFEGYFAEHEDEFEEASAKDVLLQFFADTGTEMEHINRKQRIILVANEFDEKVSAVAVWLYKNNVPLNCVKLGTYQGADGSVLITPEKYLPTPEIESYFDALRSEPEIGSGQPSIEQIEEGVTDRFVRGLVRGLPDSLKLGPFNERDVQVYRRARDFRVRMFGKNRAGYYFAKRWLRFYLYQPSRQERGEIENAAQDVKNQEYRVAFNVRERSDVRLMASLLERRLENQGEAPPEPVDARPERGPISESRLRT